MATLGLNVLVGERITEVCRVVKHGRGYRISNGFLYLTPEGSVSDGTIQNVEVYADELLKQINQHNLYGTEEVSFTIQSTRILTREVTIPPVPKKKIDATVKANIADYLPVGVDDYQIAYTYLEEVKEPQPGHHLIIQGAPIPMLDSYVDLARTLHFRLGSIDTSSNALFQALHTIKESGTTVFANITPSNTEITAIQDGKYLLQRSQPVGGDSVILPLLMANNLPISDYIQSQQLTRPESLDELDPKDLDHMKSHVSILVKSILRACDYVRTSKSAPPDRIVLSGYSAHLPLIADMIKEEIQIPVQFLEDLDGIATLTDSYDDASTYLASIGSTIAPLNLIPPSAKEKPGQKAGAAVGGIGASLNSESMTLPIVLAVICVAAGAVLSLVGFIQYKAAHDQRVDMENQIAALQPAQKLYDQWTTYTTNDKNVKVIETAATTKNAELNAIFAEFEAKMPSQIKFLSATCDQKNIVLNVTAPDKKTAAVVLDKLRDFESFDIVSCSGVTEAADETGVTTATFSVTCAYPEEPDTDGDGIPDSVDPDYQATEEGTESTDEAGSDTAAEGEAE